MKTHARKMIPSAGHWPAALLMTAVLSLASLVACARPASDEAPADGAPADTPAVQALSQSGRAFAAVAREAAPSVVFVRVEKTVTARSPLSFVLPQGNENPGDDLLRRFFNLPFGQPEQPGTQHVVGQGSGFIIGEDGVILTNNHVVGDADVVTVTLDDGREFTATIVGTDPHADVAVIKIDADHLSALPLGDSDAVEVGQWVVAVGNPFGLSQTITAGIVSATGRRRVGIADYEDFIQTDAAINPGNSGGPLLDLDGRVVGMNTAIFSNSGGYMGIGFAIPINMVQSISDQLIAHGSVTRGYLGVVIQDLTPNLARSFGLDRHDGALVAEVTAHGPAADAGLESGDLVIALDGAPVSDTGEFRNRIALTAPGTEVDLTVVRGGHERHVTVTVGRLEDDTRTLARGDHQGASFGFTVQNLTPELARQLDLAGEHGVVVTQVEPGSPAARSGLKRGALIEEVNRRAVSDVQEFRDALAAGEQPGRVLLLVKDGSYAHYLVLAKDKD